MHEFAQVLGIDLHEAFSLMVKSIIIYIIYTHYGFSWM